MNFRDFQTLEFKCSPKKRSVFDTERSDSSVVDTEQSDSSEFETVVDTELPPWLKWIALYLIQMFFF